MMMIRSCRYLFASTGLAFSLALASIPGALAQDSEPERSADSQPAAAPQDPRLESFQRHLEMEKESPHAGQPWQAVGPSLMGGRGTDIAVHPDQPETLYFATASGGVWKSVDDGRNWKPIFEKYATASIGDVAIAPSDPNIVWVGTGESNLLRSSMAGTGVYKSTDGGETFAHKGLPDSHHISRIVIHPRNPDIVYVAVSGHEYTPNAERGIFRTLDGGDTWEHVFYKNEQTSVVDLVMDPLHPGTLYAGTAPRRRLRWNDPVGGPETGVYKTTDNGRTWRPLTGNGLPDLLSGEYERVGIDLCASQPETVYVLFNHDRPTTEKVGAKVYRSDDAGETFRLIEGNEQVRGTHPGYGWFFGQIRVDPNDPETVYVMGLMVRRTRDGGFTWENIRGNHADYHGAWINPRDSRHVVIVNDGGVMISHDGLDTYFHPNNLPIAHLYNGAISQEAGKFWIYSSAQDTGAWRGLVDLSRGRDAIIAQPWERAIGDESGRHAVDPENPNLVVSVSRYGGGPALTDYGQKVVMERRGFRRSTYKTEDISIPWKRERSGRRGRPQESDEAQEAEGEAAAESGEQAESDPAEAGQAEAQEMTAEQAAANREDELMKIENKRAQWVAPIVMSPHSSQRLLYGAQYVFLSDDQGKNWQRISPDLTNFDPARQGNIAHAVVFSICESPVEKGVIYAGTDDGNVQVTRDEGKTWTNVSEGLPVGRCVAWLEACHFQPGTVYAVVNGKRHDDFGCHVYRSRDYGKNWEWITRDLPGEIANVIKQDPANENLLYLGTDRGVYVSTDAAQSWHVLGKNLPTVYVHDLAVQTVEDFVVIATHGRGCYVLDVRDLRNPEAAKPAEPSSPE